MSDYNIPSIGELISQTTARAGQYRNFSHGVAPLVTIMFTSDDDYRALVSHAILCGVCDDQRSMVYRAGEQPATIHHRSWVLDVTANIPVLNYMVLLDIGAFISPFKVTQGQSLLHNIIQHMLNIVTLKSYLFCISIKTIF